MGLICPLLASAQLAVTVSAPKVVGQKALVGLAMKNGLSNKVDSARAVCFLLDEQGKMAGQAVRWVIGGTKDQPGLPPGATNVFHFVLTGAKPFATTNLTPRVQFTRLLLEGGKLADPARDVVITPAGATKGN